jgi:hypothetical protein
MSCRRCSSIEHLYLCILKRTVLPRERCLHGLWCSFNLADTRGLTKRRTGVLLAVPFVSIRRIHGSGTTLPAEVSYIVIQCVEMILT